MNIRVLGSLDANECGASVVPTATKLRALLALLACYSGNIVPVEVIVAELWDERPPPSAATTIQTYVLHLRRIIGLALEKNCRWGPKDILQTRPKGYLLDQKGGFLDVLEYERLAICGHEAARALDYPLAQSFFVRALALWRGPALVDVRLGARLTAQATLLEESRKTVLERRIEADLQLGMHHDVIGELAALTTEYDTDEQLHAHYMVALYRAGQRSKALWVFRRLRSVLADQLGLDPSPYLSILHQKILSADPVLASAAS